MTIFKVHLRRDTMLMMEKKLGQCLVMQACGRGVYLIYTSAYKNRHHCQYQRKAGGHDQVYIQ